MYPVGSRVTVIATSRLPQRHASRLVGRTGTVWAHEDDMNLVTGLTVLRGLVAYAFTDNDLTPARNATSSQ